MTVSSAVVEVKDGGCEAVLNSLAGISSVTVFGIKGNHIVAVVEGKDAGAVAETICELNALDQVVGVYPVFTSEHE